MNQLRLKMAEYKQVILIRTDLKLPKGKMAAQAAHASVESAFRADKEVFKEWHSLGMKKIILKVVDKKELFKHIQMAKDMNLTNAVITDAGKTVVAPGTVTCGAIGPDDEEKIDNITGDLKIM